MNVILGALVRRIKQRAYLDTDEEIARWIEEYCEQSNSHKPVVVRGAATSHCISLKDECEFTQTCPECTKPATEPLPREGWVRKEKVPSPQRNRRAGQWHTTIVYVHFTRLKTDNPIILPNFAI